MATLYPLNLIKGNKTQIILPLQHFLSFFFLGSIRKILSIRHKNKPQISVPNSFFFPFVCHESVLIFLFPQNLRYVYSINTQICYNILRKIMKKGNYKKILPKDASKPKVLLNKKIRHLKIGFPTGFKSFRHPSRIEFNSLRVALWKISAKMNSTNIDGQIFFSPQRN